MAAGLLVHHLAEARIPALVASAGLLEGGRPASQEAIIAVAAHGVDLSRHRSRRLDAELLAEADLVLGMEPVHVRAVVELETSALRRSFALKDFVRRALRIGGRVPARPLGEWLGELDGAAAAERIEGDDDRDRIEDPLGRGAAAYDGCAAELHLLTRGLRHLLWDNGQTPR
jgi:protein-tyrosine phosphatase